MRSRCSESCGSGGGRILTTTTITTRSLPLLDKEAAPPSPQHRKNPCPLGIESSHLPVEDDALGRQQHGAAQLGVVRHVAVA
jgi:hypothetical protein